MRIHGPLKLRQVGCAGCIGCVGLVGWSPRATTCSYRSYLSYLSCTYPTWQVVNPSNAEKEIAAAGALSAHRLMCELNGTTHSVNVELVQLVKGLSNDEVQYAAPNGTTPLMLAAEKTLHKVSKYNRQHDTHMVATLIALGADKNILDDEGCSALGRYFATIRERQAATLQGLV